MLNTLGNKLNVILHNYIGIPNILAAAITDKDGLILASSIAQEEKELTITACGGALSRAAERIKRELTGGGGHLGAIVSTQQGEFLFTQAGENAILITLAKSGSDTDKILPWTYIVAEKIRQLIDLESPDIDLKLPSIKRSQKYHFKIAVIGDESVGKTSLIRRFIEKSFKENYKSTIGVDVLQKTYDLDTDVSVILNIWDLSGQQMFRSIRKTYIEGTHAAVVVYDVTRPETFYNIKYWLDELEDQMNSPDKFVLLLIGNKIDLSRKITPDTAIEYSKKFNFPYLETSAKTGNNVDKAFGALCYYLIKDSFN